MYYLIYILKLNMSINKYCNQLNIAFFALIFLLNSSIVTAQTGDTFQDFREKIKPYFSEEHIKDIERKLSKGRIWSWDVGDFTNDGINDVALVVRPDSDIRGRGMKVYLFAEIQGTLVNVVERSAKFYETPLEVGVAIKDNMCLITEKKEQFNWKIVTYKTSNGNILLSDSLSTEKISNGNTFEFSRNYITGIQEEIIKDSQTGEIEKVNTQRTVEVFEGMQRHERLPNNPESEWTNEKFAPIEYFSRTIEYVPSGAFYWSGEKDASFSTQFSYDRKYLKILISITDDKFISSSQAMIGDYLSLQFYAPIEAQKRKKGKFSKVLDQKKLSEPSCSIDIYHSKRGLKPEITVKVDNEGISEDNVYVSSRFDERSSGSRMIFCKIPWEILPVEIPNLGEEIRIPIDIILTDVDDEYQRNQQSKISLSTSNNEALNISQSDYSSQSTAILEIKSDYRSRIAYFLKSQELQMLFQSLGM